MYQALIKHVVCIAGVVAVALHPDSLLSQRGPADRVLREVNEVKTGPVGAVVAIVGARLIDGLGGEPVEDATIVIDGGRIVAAGTRASTPVPTGAELVKAAGLTVVPGLLDAHFHGGNDLPSVFLNNGVTSLRNPGSWMEGYDAIRKSGAPIPRLFLTGPHLDTFPPAHNGAFIVQDAEEARLAVNRFIDEGASAIKVYYRLPLGSIRAVTTAAEARGVPVVAHLEIVDALDAIAAGLSGIEHVTSFGTALVPLRRAERFRHAVLKDNEARREGRYEMWNEIDLKSPKVTNAIRLTAERGVFFTVNLAVFEPDKKDPKVTEMHLRAHKNMVDFVGMSHRGGVRVVTGSHGNVPNAERGWAYHREMELLVASGMTPLQVISASTIQNARFFRVQERLGSLEVGKLADLVLVEGNPAADITNMRKVKRVMLGGRWIPPLAKPGPTAMHRPPGSDRSH